MLDMQVELLGAIGINVAKMTPGEVFDMAGVALRDSELQTKAEAFITHGIMPSGSRVQAIKKMSPADRLRLRERVTGVVQFPRSAS